MAFVNEQSKYRTIDYDRNIILYGKGGVARGSGRLFELHIGNNVVKFGVYYKVEPTINNRANVHYKLFQISVPENLNYSKTELRELITQALKAYGSSYQTNDIDNVIVDFSPNLASI